MSIVINIRPATVADAAAIAEVHVASWRTAYRDLMPETTLAALSVAERRKSWGETIAKGSQSIFVAESNGMIVGFLALGQSRDDDAQPNTLEVLALYIAPHFWSHGAGRALLIACRPFAASLGAKLISLWVLTGNSRARQFYRSVGFREQPETARPYERNGVSLQQVRYVQIFADAHLAAMRTVRTSRFILEPQLASHAAEMFSVLSDPAIYEFENSPPASEAWLRERFQKLESRRSPDGSELWLNWVIRLPTDKLAGYVQATVRPNDFAELAYELASPFWGQGLGSAAVSAMLAEVATRYNIQHFFATLKRDNLRSLHLLKRLGFKRPTPEQAVIVPIEADELLMYLNKNALVSVRGQ